MTDAALRALLAAAIHEMGRGFHPGNMADAIAATPSGRALLDRAAQAERLGGHIETLADDIEVIRDALDISDEEWDEFTEHVENARAALAHQQPTEGGQE